MNKKQNKKEGNNKKKKYSDLSKYISAEISTYENTNKSKFRNTQQNIESEIPQYLRSRSQSKDRLSIDPEQIKKTINHFNIWHKQMKKLDNSYITK